MTTRAEKAARLEAGRRILRREGLADACVMLVARRFRPGITLDDYANVLGVSHVDIQRALARRRGTPPDPAKPTRRTTSSTGEIFRCDELGCDAAYTDRRGLASHRLAAHTPKVPCPNGCGRDINQRGIGPHLKHCPGPKELS